MTERQVVSQQGRKGSIGHQQHTRQAEFYNPDAAESVVDVPVVRLHGCSWK